MIQLFNGDCLEAMKKMKDNEFDLAIVDPPYGGSDAINIDDCVDKTKQRTNRSKYKTFENIAPPFDYFKELKRVSKKQIIWGCNFYKNIDLTGGRIVWYKHGTVFGEGEIAYYSNSKSVKFFDYVWNGMLQENMKNKEHRIHPTQKPVALYTWLLDKYAKTGDRILDTHLGSGSIAIACHNLGFDLVGYELDEDYFKAAKARLEEHQKQLRLF